MSTSKHTPAPTTILDIVRDFLIDNEIAGASPSPEYNDKKGIDIHTHDDHTIVAYEDLDENDNVEGILWELYKNDDQDSRYREQIEGGYTDIDNASSVIASILNNGNTQKLRKDPVVPVSQQEDYEIIDHETARLFIDHARINRKKLQWVHHDIDPVAGKDYYATIIYRQGATSGVISEKVPVEIAPLFTIAPDLAYTVEYQGKILEKIYRHLDDGNVLNAEQFHNLKHGSDDNELRAEDVPAGQAWIVTEENTYGQFVAIKSDDKEFPWKFVDEYGHENGFPNSYITLIKKIDPDTF